MAHEHSHTLSRQAHEHAHGLLQHLQMHKPTSSQVLGFLTFISMAGLVGGLAFTLLAPLLLFLSPVLVPVGFLVCLCTVGAVVAGGFSIAALSAISWVYNYVKGRHPPGSDQVDNARDRIHDAAEQVRRKVASSFHTNAAPAAPGA